jgi:hypothetical protein
MTTEVYVVFVYSDYRKENGINILHCFTNKQEAIDYADTYIKIIQDKYNDYKHCDEHCDPECNENCKQYCNEYCNYEREIEHNAYVSACETFYDKYIRNY